MIHQVGTLEPRMPRISRPKVDFASPGSDGSDGSQPPDTVLDIAAVHGRAKAWAWGMVGWAVPSGNVNRLLLKMAISSEFSH